MPTPLRIGAVPYVNAWPLTFGLAERADVRLRLAEPSALAPLLRGGEVDVALVPAIEYFRLSADSQERARPHAGRLAAPPRFVVLPVAAIGSRGRCGSVRLFGWAEMEKVRRVLLDPASRTSNALARLLLGRQFGVRAHFMFPRDAGEPAARRPDAELVIGDRGLLAERPDAEWVLDLGREWDRFVRHPFVFAVWAARADAPLADVARLLAEARDAGLE
ncbi:MAG: menaquinone biosynthesis protein, partial [Phycisphaerae bacterium]